MIISNVNSGEKAGFSLDGTILTLTAGWVGDITIDLQTRQGAGKKTVAVGFDGAFSQMVEGVGAWAVANIVLPAKQYEYVDTGEVDGEGNPIYETNELPLDMGQVVLRLWGLPGERSVAAAEEPEEEVEPVEEPEEEEEI